MPDNRVSPPLSNRPDDEDGQRNDKPEEPQSNAKRPQPSNDSSRENGRENGRSDAFSHFVNDQLDLSSLAEPGVRLHAVRFTPTEPNSRTDSDDGENEPPSLFRSGLRAMLGSSSDSDEDEDADDEFEVDDGLFDHDEAEDEDEEDPPTRRGLPVPFGTVFGAGLPFGGRSPSSSREEAKTSPFSTTRRVPAYNDPRWVKGFYSVARDLEIHLPSLLTPRVMVFANAHLRLNRRIEYIRDIAPGYSAVKWYRQGQVIPNVIIGLVKNADVRLRPATGLRARLVPEVGLLYRGLVGEILTGLFLYAALLLLLVLAGLLFLNVLLPDTTLRAYGIPVFDEDVPAAVETRLGEQQAQIDQLEATIRTLRGDR